MTYITHGLVGFDPLARIVAGEDTDDVLDPTSCSACLDAAAEFITGGTLDADTKQHVFEHVSINPRDTAEHGWKNLQRLAAIALNA